MPLNIDLNVPPYFDDYDEAKNYHRILFRPSVAVQARELTQAQTILQNQIERFGNWAFKSGDIVDGCTIADIPVLPFVFLNNAGSSGSANSVIIDTRAWINCVAVSATSNLQAKILYANVGFQANYPNSNIIYLNYLNTGTSGQVNFAKEELLQIVRVAAAGNTTIANVYTISNTSVQNATGTAHGITVSEGVIFINGVFVKNESPLIGIVKSFDTNAGNSVVGFILNEEVVTENQDSSLHDNALGYPNENAPGAHRLKLTPQLIAYANAAVAAASSNTFNAIAQYNFNSIVQKNADDKLYATVGKAIAKRTYEESGNYVINPFVIDTVTNIASSVISSVTANTVLGRISPGVGYAQGQRVELEKTAYINMRRGVDTESRTDQIITFNYGSYYELNEVAGSFDFSTAQRVNFYANTRTAVTSKTFNNVSLPGTSIGNAAVRMFTFNNGVVGTNTATYLLHVYDIKMASGYKPDDVLSVAYSSGGSVVGVGDLATIGLQQAASKSMLYTYNSDLAVKNYNDKDSNYRLKYIYRKKIAAKTMNSSGVVTVTSAVTGPNDILPYSGRLPFGDAATFTLVAGEDKTSSARTGTVVVNTTSTTVTANGTSGSSFAGLAVGDLITVTADTQPKTIVSITNNTSMAVDSVFSTTNTFAQYFFNYVKGQEIPVNAGTAYVNVDSSSAFTIFTKQAMGASMSVDVVFDVMRTQAPVTPKEIRKNRFVKIDTAANPKGPWCLGFSDVHQITKIYASDSTYTTSGFDVTNKFVFDNGQKDTHYDLGYLYNVSHDIITYPKILVQLDYFFANTDSNVGFFNIDSYPIDDANTANTTAIQTKDIPLYMDENGSRIPLRSYIDFRTPSVSTATDTGTCNTANPTQVTTSIGLASIVSATNQLNTLTLKTGAGLNPPTYGENLTSDLTYYLPRKDIVYITAENVIKIKEGLSSLSPKVPLQPDNAMTIASINVPPYPSLSTDQLDGMLQYNKSSISLIRDTSVSITSGITTNRGYTMKDIAKLDKRISNLEYYTQLNLLEKKAADMQVTDANGLNRFKNGIFVDSFSNYTNQLPSDPDYRLAIDSQKGVGRPYITQKSFNANYNSGTSSGTQLTGRLVTLPYTSVPFMTQNAATKYRSAALVASAWNGSVKLFPSMDNNYDLDATGSYNVTIDNLTPWKDFANSPAGSNYGTWRTISSAQIGATDVKSGPQLIVTKNIGIERGMHSSEPAAFSKAQLYNILVSAGEKPTANWTIGSVSYYYASGGTRPTGGASPAYWYSGARDDEW